MSIELDEYSKHIPASRPLESHYGRHASYRDEKQLQAIDAWVRMDIPAEQNRPLLVAGAPLSGRKTLLVQWAALHRNLRVHSDLTQKDDIVLVQFASRGSGKHAETIYDILSCLRVPIRKNTQEQLQINQKVQTNEQKLRRFFQYWMEVCSKALHKKSLEEGESRRRKIVIVIGDIDKFTNQNGEPLLPGFWLPETFPEDIRVLVSAREGSPAAVSLKQVRTISMSEKGVNDIKESLLLRLSNMPNLHKLLTDNKDKINLQYCRLVLQLFSTQNPFFEILKEFDFALLKEFSLAELCRIMLKFWEGKLLTKRSLEETFKVLILSKKGLTAGEVCCLANLRPAEFKKFVCVFDGLVEGYDGIWFIPDQQAKSRLLEILQMDAHKISSYHLQMAKGLRQLSQSLRKLQQQTYHLFQGGSLPQLKQTISQVENFLLLFNWHTKYQLCHYWKQLELKHAFDPVFEYNRSLTAFEMHSYPSEENLFRLLLQLSRFFIEYAHFEMYNTPTFRHPLIKGDEDQLNELHVLMEFKAMGMLMERQIKYTANKSKTPICNKTIRTSITNSSSFADTNREHTALLQNRIQQIVECLANKKPVRLRQTKPEKADRYVYLTENREWIETVSLDIPSNKTKFQQHYLKQLTDYFLQAHLELYDPPADTAKTEQSEHAHALKRGAVGDSILSFSQFEEEKYHLSFRQPKNYYYKQWLWIQFPWISMSLNCDYSRLIRKCIQGSTQYIDVAEEKQLTTKAIVMSMEAHKKKCLALNSGRRLEKLQARQSLVRHNTENRRQSTSRQPTNQSKLTERKSNKEFQLTKELEQYKVAVKKHGGEPTGEKGHNMFLTSIGNEEIREPLPTLRTQHPSKQNTFDSLDLKRAYNTYSYENSRLQKKIMELKKLESTFQQGDTQQEEDQLLQQLKKATKKGDELRTTLAKTLIHQEKLRTIIDICHQNKICNSETVSPLHNHVSNLKAMIEATKNDIKKLKDTSRAAEKELKQQLQALQQQLAKRDYRNIHSPSQQAPDSASQAEAIMGTPTQYNNTNVSFCDGSNEGRFLKTVSSKHPMKNSVSLIVEQFQKNYGELSLTNPKIVQVLEAIENRKSQQRRMIELELQRDTIASKLSDLKQNVPAALPTYSQNDEGKPIQQSSSLGDLHDQLELAKQKKASLLMFVAAIEEKMRKAQLILSA